MKSRGLYSGRPEVFAAFGAGFHWGALLAEFDCVRIFQTHFAWTDSSQNTTSLRDAGAVSRGTCPKDRRNAS